MPVRILDETVINKIAAGEVVERPASVVKELFENALDAGAKSVRVHLRAGGRNLIRVVDDGVGMNKTDALMSTERHATSKIRSDEDLFSVATLGFRGEAIPSIASVSRFELLTRPRDAELGTRVRIEGGRLEDVSPAGCAPGTEVSVASLFYNVPARRKFLRAVDTELGHCVEAVQREALIRPWLDVEVSHDDRELLRAPPTPSRARRAADLLGPHGEALVPVSFSRGSLTVEALVSPVGVHRASPTGSTWLYVNGRFVRDLVLRRAVTAAYAGIVPKDRYPLVILEVTVPPADVDVNVHPAKVEVRFVHGFELQNAVTTGLRTALQDHGIRRPVAVEARYRAPEPQVEQLPLVGRGEGGGVERPEARAPDVSDVSDGADVSLRAGVTHDAAVSQVSHRADVSHVSGGAEGSHGSRGADEARPAPPANLLRDTAQRRPASPPPPTVRAPPAAWAPTAGGPRSLPAGGAGALPRSGPSASPPRAPAPRPGAPSAPHAPDALLPVPRFRDLRVIGQLGGTYVLCEGAGELVVIDQHAAHERITLHRLRADPRATLGGAQRLLTPLLVDLPLHRARALAPHVEALEAWGLEVRAMGGATFAIQALPAPLRDADLPALLADVADEVAEGGAPQAAGEHLDHFLATLACHTSVRAGQVLSTVEMERLLRGLDEVDFSVCAHGRPVAIRVGPGELERRFHRA